MTAPPIRTSSAAPPPFREVRIWNGSGTFFSSRNNAAGTAAQSDLLFWQPLTEELAWQLTSTPIAIRALAKNAAASRGVETTWGELKELFR